MGLAILDDIRVSETVPPVYFVTYVTTEGVDAGDDSTALVTLNLNGPGIDDTAMRMAIDTRGSGAAYMINLHGFGISCSATSFGVRILTRNDIALIDTVYEVAAYTGLNLSSYDATFTNFYITNMDDALNANLYLYFSSAAGDMGTTTIQFVYSSMRDRRNT